VDPDLGSLCCSGAADEISCKSSIGYDPDTGEDIYGGSCEGTCVAASCIADGEPVTANLYDENNEQVDPDLDSLCCSGAADDISCKSSIGYDPDTGEDVYGGSCEGTCVAASCVADGETVTANLYDENNEQVDPDLGSLCCSGAADEISCKSSIGYDPDTGEDIYGGSCEGTCVAASCIADGEPVTANLYDENNEQVDPDLDSLCCSGVADDISCKSSIGYDPDTGEDVYGGSCEGTCAAAACVEDGEEVTSDVFDANLGKEEPDCESLCCSGVCENMSCKSSIGVDPDTGKEFYGGTCTGICGAGASSPL